MYKAPNKDEKFAIFMADKRNIDDPSYSSHKIPNEFLKYEFVNN